MMLEVTKIDSFYGDLHVLRKVSLTVKEGEFVALFGPNGHGKSTLLRSVSGLHPPESGSIKYRGNEISRTAMVEIVQMGLSYVPEERNLFLHLTVLENLKLGAYNSKARGGTNKNLEFVFSLFPRLEERKNQLCATLSGGESRMVAIGRGLMSSASMLMVDEPSIGLSPVLKGAVFDCIARINQEKQISILVVEQEIEHILALAQRVYVIKRGEILFEQKAEDIDRAEVEKAYF